MIPTPLPMVEPLNVHDAGAAISHDEYAYVPDSCPLEHMRICEAHWVPYATLEDWYARTDAPATTVVPLKAQFAGGVTGDESTVHDANGYVPESVPLLHTRDCEEHVPPAATDELWYAFTDAPFAIGWPLNAHNNGASTPHVAYWKVPDNVPLLHKRDSEMHCDPLGAVDD
jgi:hypothetical protein